jgi:gliding motility-associated protein GldE
LDTEPPSLLLVVGTVHWGLVGGMVLLLALLACSALISGSEMAFFSLDGNQLRQLDEDDHPKARRILALRDKPRRLLATILIANNLVNIGIVIVSYFLLHTLFPAGTFLEWGTHINAISGFAWLTPGQWGATLQFLIAIVAITFLLVMFGEVLPKIYANLDNVRFALRMSGPLHTLMVVFAPASKALVRMGNAIENRLRPENALGANKDDIDRAIDLAVARDPNSAMEADILKSIVGFNDVAVKQIMRSRMDILALDVTMSREEMLAAVRDAGYSRLPVYAETLDNVRGILYVKDLIATLDVPGPPADWTSLIREEVLYVPEARKINELLKDFQREHLHMAIVVDEYGGTSGLVTLEDVIEEVIGDIKDEFDEDQELEYRRLGEREYIFEGKTMLIDVCRVMDIDKASFDRPDAEADSLAGLILELHGKMPVVGQQIDMPPFSFTILSVSARRIERIKVQLHA